MFVRHIFPVCRDAGSTGGFSLAAFRQSDSFSRRMPNAVRQTPALAGGNYRPGFNAVLAPACRKDREYEEKKPSSASSLPPPAKGIFPSGYFINHRIVTQNPAKDFPKDVRHIQRKTLRNTFTVSQIE
jgi:hypothetical protein